MKVVLRLAMVLSLISEHGSKFAPEEVACPAPKSSYNKRSQIQYFLCSLVLQSLKCSKM